MGTNFNKAAFPVLEHGGNGLELTYAGMTLRDYFAIHASDEDLKAQGEILRYLIREAKGVAILPDDWRVTARYMHADAMLKAREAK